MRIAKRIFLFMAVNILIVATLSIVLSLLGVNGYMRENGIDFGALAVFCFIWGMGGAFISLALSRVMAKWMMGVKVIDPMTTNIQERQFLNRVHGLASRAGLQKMPEVGIYESPEINAFATGPTKNRALVAVSTGLLRSMSEREVDGVLAHEVAHVANGDMVTMTLVQGIVNAFVMFLARVAAFVAGQAVEERNRPMVEFAVVMVLQILLGILGMMVVAAFSRRREYRADTGGAQLAGRDNMIAALERLKLNTGLPDDERGPALASLKISGKRSGFVALFSTHPDLDDRIAALRRPVGA